MGAKRRIESLLGTKEIAIVSRGSIDDDGSIEGYVVAAGQDFFLLQVFSDTLRLDGYYCLRYKDVVSCEVSSKRSAFYLKVVDLKKTKITNNIGIQMETIETIIMTSTELFDLVAVYLEEEDPDACVIGNVLDLDDGLLRMTVVDSNGEIAPGVAVFDMSEITRLDLGGEYIETIGLVAEASPHISRDRDRPVDPRMVKKPFR